MTNQPQWGPWFQGTGERPESVRDGDLVAVQFDASDECQVLIPAVDVGWFKDKRYRLHADHPHYTKDDSPPLWALDEATRRGTDYPNWEAIIAIVGDISSISRLIRAHARTIAKYETPPDPDAVYREYCARLLEAFGYGLSASSLRNGDSPTWGPPMIAELKTIIAEHGGKP